MDLYSHLLESIQKSASDCLDGLFSGKSQIEQSGQDEIDA